MTWKVLFTMLKLFGKEVIFIKQKTQIVCRRDLNMKTDHISNNKIRNAYIERVDRKQAFEKLKLMSNPVQMNEHQKVKIKIYSDSDDISSINSD